MWFNRDNSKKFEELEEEIKKIRRELEAVKLDLQIYYHKLKAVKNIKPIDKEKDEEQNINKGVILPERYG